MDQCIFCKIGSGEIKSDIVYQDDKVVAFLDTTPKSKGHTLIIPKSHADWMQDASDEDIKIVFLLAKKIMIKMKNLENCKFVRLSVVGTEVAHFHVHLIPVYSDYIEIDEVRLDTHYRDDEEKQAILETIKI